MRWTEAETATLSRLYADGRGYKAIAAVLGRSDASVNWKLKQLAGTGAVERRNAPRVPARHGADSMYQRGCRCEGCKQAHREKQREYRRRKLALAAKREELTWK